MNRIGPAALALLVGWASTASAHDVPDHVRIAAFLKPEPGRMLVLVRMPANAFIDFMFPTLPEGPWLDLRQAEAVAAEGAEVWIADMLSLYEGGSALARPRVLAVRVSRLDDPSFKTFGDALGHVTGAGLPTDTLVTLDQASVDALLQTPITSVDSDFSFEPRFARVGVVVETALTFLSTGGGIRRFQYDGNPEPFALDPGPSQAIRHFIRAGFDHWFNQTDTLLFVLSIAVVFRRLRRLLPFVAVFLCAQALLVIGSPGQMPVEPWLPPLSRLLLAATTVYTGIEAIIGRDDSGIPLAVGAGLVFGLGCWFDLQPIVQFGGGHAIASGLGFTLGVVTGELLALAVCVTAVRLLSKFLRAPQPVLVIVAAVIIHICWRQMIQRATGLALPANLDPVGHRMLALTGAMGIAALAGWAYYWRRGSSLTS